MLDPLQREEIKMLIEEVVKEQLRDLLASDRYVFQKGIQLLDGRNIQTGRTTGTKIALSTSEKVGFFGVTPVVQQSGPAKISGGTDQDGALRGNVSTLIDALAAIGIIA